MNWRFIILSLIIFLSLISLVFRTLFLQILNPDPLIREGDRRSSRVQSLFNIRGVINDRTGSPLAVTVTVNSIGIDPMLLINKKNIEKNPRWKALSDIVSIPLKQIIFRINAHPKEKFIYLSRQCSLEIGMYAKKLNLLGIIVLEESKRYYPTGKTSSQLIGITDIDGKGIEGVEKSFDKILAGIPGKRKIRKNKKGQIIENISLIKPYKSNILTLSIDIKLQKIVHYQLEKAVNDNKADSGTAILLDIHTGEILAMVNSPSYNPNKTSYSILNNMRNRAISDVFEPGSIIKPIVIMKALEEGIITKKSIIQTKPYFIKKHQIHDVSYHKELTVNDILTKSSNVGISKIALSMPIEKLNEIYSAFGLGKSTNTGLFGEKKGFLFSEKKRSNLDKATLSFGYGLMMTPLQLVRLYATIGSYGIYHPLSILKINRINNGTRIFSHKITQDVLHMMEHVTKKGGSGTRAAVKNYRIAAKTGTVKKIGLKKKYINKYISYTAGIAPVENPKLSLIVIIDNPKNGKYYGGIVAAPVFSAIMKLALHKMHIKKDNII